MVARPAFRVSIRISTNGHWKAMYREYPCNNFINEAMRGGEIQGLKGALTFSPPVNGLLPQQRHEASLSRIITAQEEAGDISL